MSTSATEITNLLFRYAEHMDAGDLDAAAALFTDAALILDRSEGAAPVRGVGPIRAIWDSVILYADGTPRTKHVTTNPILDIDEEAGTATCRSYYTVFQQLEDLPLQPIITGRYHDRFERVEGRWRFAERDYTLVDQIGDLSRHLTIRLG
jgi:3-phenylpropionate/cinnamic acid dioxygenase small subunit